MAEVKDTSTSSATDPQLSFGAPPQRNGITLATLQWAAELHRQFTDEDTRHDLKRAAALLKTPEGDELVEDIRLLHSLSESEGQLKSQLALTAVRLIRAGYRLGASDHRDPAAAEPAPQEKYILPASSDLASMSISMLGAWEEEETNDAANDLGGELTEQVGFATLAESFEEMWSSAQKTGDDEAARSALRRYVLAHFMMLGAIAGHALPKAGAR